MGWLVQILGGGLAGQLREAYEARLRAANDADRIAAEIRIAELQERQANRALGGRLTAWVQAAWAAPFILYNAKLLIWDKVLGLDATDALSADLLDLQLRIVTFYFGGAAAIGVVRELRR
ncbi:hypothetical protein DSD19_04470 [Rhodovulum sp. BSW8]|nr:hypothetical protein [Rhodovulum sp. BSW8]RBO54636.1 hypothetical protein DSD19_04470 [Rhodovulum sp. BSW8]